MFVVKRSRHNPVLVPSHERFWEAFATFNLSPHKFGKGMIALYRAVSLPDSLQNPSQISIIGRAKSLDGSNFTERASFIEPKMEWERFGCEDPRVTYFEGNYYTFYTALSHFPFCAEGIKVAVAVSKDLKKVSERHLVTPFNAKAMALFPERIGGKITVILSAHTDSPPAKMAIAQVDSMDELWSEEFWEKWHAQIDTHTLDPRRNDSEHVEVGAVPIKTKHGWLLIYSHIQNYFPSSEHFDRVFGIEAVLLDLNDPRKIIGRTHGPLLFPEEPYEMSGYVANVIFPSGAIVIKNTLVIYYGAADTTVCKARVNLTDLISSMASGTSEKFKFKRYTGNPIISPNPSNSWESVATFNPAAIELNKKIRLLYRASSSDNTSSIGYAVSEDGLTISERLVDPIYVPRESFESKKIPNTNSGCEDPRLTKIGSKLYMCYTAFDGIGPARAAITSIEVKDFLARKFNWEKPFLVTPPGVDDKDTCILPRKFNNKYLIFHRIGSDICADYLDTLDFKKHEMVNKCIKVLGPRVGNWDTGKVGISAPPIETSKGWLLLYHASSKNDHVYRVGAVLLDKKDPTVLLARSTDPIFEPEEIYEKEGIVNNVVFPCGAVVRNGLVYIYYGGADRVTGVATMKLSIVLKALVNAIKY
ncbi:MAG: hypothetical protein EXS46_00060 [Candidatus Taylorbacteria bacterium]|nr:hypothetical protein [Candidatus Taylorbacteria bacterium]